jgi:L-iditol 2-dehydrogenase
MRAIRAVVMQGPGKGVEVREIPEPDLGQEEALLAVELSEVCGTDVHLAHGRLAGVPYPIVPGHVSVGRLAKIRGKMRDVEGRALSEGDAVTFLDVHATCNACWYCLVAKASTRCPSRKVYGITYGLSDGLTGGWAEQVHLKRGTRVLPLAGSAFEHFMAGGCALPTAIHALERAEVALGDSVLVLGSGPVGLVIAILARLSGAARVLVIGAPSHRLDTALAVGADMVLDLTKHDESARGDWVREATGGRGADVTVEASGDPRAVVQALRWTRDAGRVVIAGQYTDGGDVSFNPHRDLNKKHLEIRASWGSDYSHFHRAVRLMADAERSAPFARLPLQRFGLDRASEALAAVQKGEIVKALIDPRAH